MTANNHPNTIRGPPTISSREDLESLLSQSPTLETDLMDFLLIAGYRYVFAPIYKRSSPEVRALLEDRYRRRRAQLDMPTKVREGRVAKALLRPYARGEATTIGTLKRLVEEEGRLFNNFRYVSLATLNNALVTYGLDPIKVSGHVSEAMLRRYGLQKHYPR